MKRFRDVETRILGVVSLDLPRVSSLGKEFMPHADLYMLVAVRNWKVERKSEYQVESPPFLLSPCCVAVASPTSRQQVVSSPSLPLEDIQGESEECMFLLMECIRATIDGEVVGMRGVCVFRCALFVSEL